MEHQRFSRRRGRGGGQGRGLEPGEGMGGALGSRGWVQAGRSMGAFPMSRLLPSKHKIRSEGLSSPWKPLDSQSETH